MSGADTNTFLGATKVYYGPESDAFKKQQNLHSEFWKMIPLSDLKPSKKGSGVPVSMSGNESVRAVNERQPNRAPGAANPVEALVFTREIRGECTLTGRQMALSRSDKQAFATGYDIENMSQLATFLSSMERQALGKGTGQMSLANGAGAATTLLVVGNIFLFRRGMFIDAFDVLGGTKEINDVEIVFIDPATSTITLASPQTWSDSAIIGESEVFDGAPVGGKEITGFQAICDTTVYSTTFENIPVAANPEWVGNVFSAAGAPLSQSLLQDSYDFGSNVGQAKPKLLISNRKQRRVFLDTELQKTRYEAQDVKGGFKESSLMWNEMKWHVNSYYDLDEVGMCDLENIAKIQAGEPDIADLDGDKLTRLQGMNEYSFMRVWYGNLVTFKRNSQTRLINLAVPV